MDARSIGIIGVGVMGGSIALAALRAGYRVCLYDSIHSGSLISERFDGATTASSVSDLVSESRLIILAVPVRAVAQAAAEISRTIRPDQIVTDVASVKRAASAELAQQLRGRAEYVPSHPMAGSEKSGANAARADLFERAVSLVSPEFASNTAPVDFVAEFWSALGCRVVFVSVERHDELVALMSHLPHLVAAILVRQVACADDSALSLSGSGFRDTTRIASGSPSLWTDILLSNSDALVRHLKRLALAIEDAGKLLEQKDAKNLQALLDDAKQNRDRIWP